ncbi:MAG: hypothetical protein ACYC6M_11515 [Terriglobales bacterium]
MSDHDTPPPVAPGALEERSGYQGTRDPGRPTGMMQQQTQPAAQQLGTNVEPTASAGNQASLAADHQSSGTDQ